MPNEHPYSVFARGIILEDLGFITDLRKVCWVLKTFERPSFYWRGQLLDLVHYLDLGGYYWTWGSLLDLGGHYWTWGSLLNLGDII